MDALQSVMAASPTLGPDPAALAAQTRSNDPRGNASVAHGFESVFASLIVKQMRQTLGPDTLFSKDSGDVLGGMFDHYLGQHLAQMNALGIGKLVQQQLTQATHHDTASRAPTRPGNPVRGESRASAS